MESKSKLDEAAVKLVEMSSHASGKSDHRLHQANHKILFDGPNEKLALGRPWTALADKVAWWNPLEVWPRSPANPMGSSALLHVPPQEIQTPPLVPSTLHQDVAFGFPVERSFSDGFLLSERSGSSPFIPGPLINRPRTPDLSCSSKAETVSIAGTRSFANLAPTRSYSSHRSLFPEKVACSLPSMFHDGREGRSSLRSRVAPLSPERVQQAVKPLSEGSSLLRKGASPEWDHRLEASPERVHRAVLPPREGTWPEQVHWTVVPPCEGSSLPAVMPPSREGSSPVAKGLSKTPSQVASERSASWSSLPAVMPLSREGTLPVASVLSRTPSQVARERSASSRRLSPERVQTLQRPAFGQARCLMSWA